MTPVAALTPLVWIAAAAACAALTVSHFRLCRCRAMVAQAVHELRAPITAARLALDGLGPSTRVAAADLELRRAARALDDLAAAPAGRRLRHTAETVDLGGLLRAAAEGWQPIATRHGADVRLELPPQPLVVGADPLRILQACGNLVANACEHGGGSVRVRARGSDQRVRVEVTDTGPGLPAPVADLVRAARGRRTRRGHGLALAAAIAERHGGRLTSAPSPRGARLVLELPALTDGDHRSAPARMEPGRAPGRRANGLRAARRIGLAPWRRASHSRAPRSIRLVRSRRASRSPSRRRIRLPPLARPPRAPDISPAAMEADTW